jgi:lysophospholipase L1-like esterase
MKTWLIGPLVSLVVLAALLAGLEGLARVYVRRFAPTALRDGVYQSRLPLITGITPASFQGASYPGERLTESKMPNEVRVAVVGESSVEGSPFSPHASAPTMLHDRLQELLREKTVTVVNLGRVGSIAANAWYTLLYLRRFQPDVVVLYMGYNDTPDLGGEQCWAAEHPDLHGAWRWLVQRSWLAWAVRSAGPAYLSKLTGAAKGYHPQHRDAPCPAPAFPAWARLVVQAAEDTGAAVLVTLPVRNPSAYLEPGLVSAADGRNDLSTLDAPYRDLLRCRLTPGCDLTLWLRAAAESRYVEGARQVSSSLSPSGLSRVYTPQAAVGEERQAMAVAWQQAVDQAVGARRPLVLNFAGLLRPESRWGYYGVDLFLDEVHLTLEGYQRLAWLWADAVADLQSAGAGADGAIRAGTPHTLEPAAADLERYRDDTRYLSTGVALNAFLRGWYLSALPLMQLAAEWCPNDTCDPAAPLALAWLRHGVGLEPGVPETQMPAVLAFTPLDWLK